MASSGGASSSSVFWQVNRCSKLGLLELDRRRRNKQNVRCLSIGTGVASPFVVVTFSNVVLFVFVVAPNRWWDVVDYIGVDAYYPILPDDPDPTLDNAVKAWEPVVQRLHNLTLAHNKSLIITEIGYCSPDCKRDAERLRRGRVVDVGVGGGVALSAVTSDVNLRFQAVHYEAMFVSLWNSQTIDWFAGVFWWSWNTDPAFGGETDRCISPQFKPAQDVLRRWYGGEQRPLPIRPSQPASCLCTV